MGDLDGLCEPVAANLALEVFRASIASELLVRTKPPFVDLFLAEELHVSGIVQ